MSTSGSRNFILTRDDIIESALRKLGVLGQGDSATNQMKAEAAEALNVMVLEWQNMGVFLWTQSRTTQSLTDGTTSYTLSADVIEVDNVFYREDGADTEIDIITRQEYEKLSDKSEEGRPVSVYIDFQLAAPVMYFYPTPDTTTSGDEDIVYYTQTVRLQDFDSAGDTPDFPVRFYKAMIYGLAADLAPEYGMPAQEWEVKGYTAFVRAKGGDTEKNMDLKIRPGRRRGR